jgi:hypothetical protein
MHLVKGHHCCPNFLAQPIRREEKIGPTIKLAIYEQKCKLSKQTNRQISLVLLAKCLTIVIAAVRKCLSTLSGRTYTMKASSSSHYQQPPSYIQLFALHMHSMIVTTKKNQQHTKYSYYICQARAP